ncbi:hypothetical protein Nocox_20290 [Nonomuraea coxensis DSM 45129]|uniref:Polymer-forming cytoskeletal protein n=1 Tax=Nonomuraea coxensis DSM 45129 TaxID=1122611 RepID=A0ABX8U4W0_9ACTN|nr:hypothetical protein [Nonomuraea coxensis]QYC41667.1 hypothetical protein Nocox_20290 [Nonomuraea coxensis DSM 45129]
MNERTQRLLARCLLTAVGAVWILLLGASPAAAGCGTITYEQRQDPGRPGPANEWIVGRCDQSVPAAAAAVACALGLVATGWSAWRLHRAGAAAAAPTGPGDVEVVGPGEVRSGDVDGDVVIQGGTLVGHVSGTVVMVEGATFIGTAGNVVQIGARNNVIGDIDEGTLVQARSVLGGVLSKGRKLWPLD